MTNISSTGLKNSSQVSEADLHAALQVGCFDACPLENRLCQQDALLSFKHKPHPKPWAPAAGRKSPCTSQLRVASRSCWANAFMACRPASGVGASPKALTNALPTMTPSAPQDITCWACTNQITGNIKRKHSSHSKDALPFMSLL